MAENDDQTFFEESCVMAQNQGEQSMTSCTIVKMYHGGGVYSPLFVENNELLADFQTQ